MVTLLEQHRKCHSVVMPAAARFDTACTFLFPDSAGVHSITTGSVRRATGCERSGNGHTAQHADPLEERKHHGDRRPVLDALDLPPPAVGNMVAALLPAAVTALHPAGLSATGAVVPAMMPVVVPNSMPSVSSDIWLGNKRARAYHRCCVLAVYAQGTVALMKVISGDLVSGFLDGFLAAIGAAATQPDSSKLMPTYTMVAGFNGGLGIIQALQSCQGVALHNLPLFLATPAIISVLGAYCGWQFCKEIRAIAAGYTGSGPQNSCFVRICSADCWPLASLSPLPRGPRHDHAFEGEEPDARPGFEAFGGRGQRLAET